MKDLQPILTKLNEIHNETEAMVDNNKVSGMLMKEYIRGVEQYTGMYKSIEDFKAFASEKSIENFIEQQFTILNNWIEFEQDIQKKIIDENQ